MFFEVLFISYSGRCGFFKQCLDISTTFLQEFTEESDEDHAFPTLDEALIKIDQNCGFNIELKWDVMLKDGSNECHNPFEINLFLNAVLESVLKHGQRRKIVFSSFSPDVCTL